MAKVETRAFGSVKHFLVVLNRRETKLLFATLGRSLPVKVQGEAVISDDCTTVYIRFKKGAS